MPLWQVYHPVGSYTPEDKQQFAADVTDFYQRIGLPRFYVVTLFHEVEGASCFVGGEPSEGTVRVVIEHIARHSQDPAERGQASEAISRLVAPYTRDRGLYCEFHVDETPQDLWMTDGVAPPTSGSDAERLWARENRPVPY
ncbi:tautomerase family protein [Nonomuraea pusilla]|uniref:tautomerase family protein n=1 Tax=Nonomuraea pusilla TaxID=46177 RepID=UPI0033172DEB